MSHNSLWNSSTLCRSQDGMQKQLALLQPSRLSVHLWGTFSRFSHAGSGVHTMLCCRFLVRKEQSWRKADLHGHEGKNPGFSYPTRAEGFSALGGCPRDSGVQVPMKTVPAAHGATR